jgi:hypothetical protein
MKSWKNHAKQTASPYISSAKRYQIDSNGGSAIHTRFADGLFQT